MKSTRTVLGTLRALRTGSVNDHAAFAVAGLAAVAVFLEIAWR